MAKVHIGKKIKEVWKASRLKGTEFAAMINKDRQVIYDIFERETIDTGLLDKISKVLNHDFFNYYSSSSANIRENKTDYGYATKQEVSEIAKAVELLAKEIGKLREEMPTKKQAEKTKKKYNSKK